MDAGSVARDRLQPALLDRLIDLNPHEKAVESAELRLISKTKLRQMMLRDLGDLFNAPRGLTTEEERRYPNVATSTVNYGLVSLTGQLASGLEVHDVEQMMRKAILAFEPRLLPETLIVKAVLSADDIHHDNVIGFEIGGRLWAEPYPMELLLRTDVDLETGKAMVTELTRTTQREAHERRPREE
jgi:type VI secretion system protein ImpF